MNYRKLSLLLPALIAPATLLRADTPPPPPLPGITPAATAPATPDPQQTTPPATPAPTTTTNTGAPQPPISPNAPAPEDPSIAEAKKEISRMAVERDRLTTENAIAKERLTKELAERRADLERANLRAEEAKMRMNRELEELRTSSERETAKLKLENEKLALESNLLKTRSEMELTKVRMAEAEVRTAISRMENQIEQKNKQLESAKYAATAAPQSLEAPHNGNKLTISDRRIPLNGPIISRTADQIADRIDYFNNVNDKLPIFIVIDSSPGGSVMAGYKILRAMDGSRAPIYVVVKQFAASMAACITTLADHSFCYPNAQILHHQISSVAFGNLTVQRESLAEIEQWWQRLAGPIAKKMGVTPEDFIKQMYSHTVTGDWTEFGENAKKLKWVDEVVDDIYETGILKHPDLNPPLPEPKFPFFDSSGKTLHIPLMVETRDEKGQPCMILPRALPKDVYYLYNPDGFYRLP